MSETEGNEAEQARESRRQREINILRQRKDESRKQIVKEKTNNRKRQLNKEREVEARKGKDIK